MSGIKDYKITDTTGYKVADVPGDTLSGTVAQNKATFDKLAELIITKLNGAIDYLYGQNIDSGAEAINAYPVGSIYMSVNSTSPTSLFGGTWVQLKDCFLLAAGDTYAAASTGGSADAVAVSHYHAVESQSVTGTAASAGAHSHTYSRAYPVGFRMAEGTEDELNVWDGIVNTSTTSSTGAHTHSVTGTVAAFNTESAGVSGTGKNMPPYLAVYVWKRTA